MDSPVILYTMSYCPYCEAAKRLLKRRDVIYKEIHVADDDDAQWDSLYQRSGMKTMPQVFAGERLIGGYAELVELDAEDELASLKRPLPDTR